MSWKRARTIESLRRVFSWRMVRERPQRSFWSKPPFLSQLSECTRLPSLLPFDSAFSVLAVDIQADSCLSEHFLQTAVSFLSSMRTPPPRALGLGTAAFLWSVSKEACFYKHAWPIRLSSPTCLHPVLFYVPAVSRQPLYSELSFVFFCLSSTSNCIHSWPLSLLLSLSISLLGGQAVRLRASPCCQMNWGKKVMWVIKI